jgi:hypothetical protein
LSPIRHLFDGRAVTVGYRANLRDTAGHPAHAATSISQRAILLDPGLKKRAREHRRVLLHEYFHFAFVRLGNPRRWAWDAHLRSEWQGRARGEAGWSAEWRKQELAARDVTGRSRRWREYCCESFCDTAAWIAGGVDSEVTLSRARRRARLAWFDDNFAGYVFPI